MTTPTFTFGGLSSGLDTNKIIDTLVNLERRTVTLAQRQQEAYRTQVSLVGDLSSKLSALATAASGLGESGVLGFKQVGTTSGFTTSLAPSAVGGSYSVLVNELAAPAKARSAGFAAGVTVTGGTLSLSINGTSHDITIDDGASLDAVARAINDSSAPVSAVVLDADGTRYLSITNQDSGYTVGQPADSALSITHAVTGAQGQALGMAIIQPAKNASFTVDGLPFTRSSNTISDALPGVTFSLTAKTTTAETLTVATDAEATRTTLDTFITAYNDVMTLVRKQLDIRPEVDRTTTLAGDASVRSLQTSLQQLVSRPLTADGAVRTLADLGITTGGDGTLSLDSAALDKVLASQPSAVNRLFSEATTGLADLAGELSDRYTDPVDGLFTAKKSSLDGSIRRMDSTIASMELRLDAYRTRLINQFTAMEKVVSGFKSIGEYLTQQTAQRTKSDS